MEAAQQTFHLEHRGHCEICDQDVVFTANGHYLRNTLRCPVCMTLPRSRALFYVLKRYFPHWRNQAVHESSPGGDFLSRKFKNECKGYVATQWDPDIAFGSDHPVKQYRSEDLQNQTFQDESFDLVITQDVFEHVFRPDSAIKEIARTLKPKGAFVCTVPIVNLNRVSQRRAGFIDGEIKHFAEPSYHGNPMSKDGSLVTVDWGYDIVPYLHHHSGLYFNTIQIDNIDLGIRAELNEVLVGYKRQAIPNI